MFNRVYELLLHFKEYVLFAVLVIFSLMLLVMNNSPQIKQIRTYSTVIMGFVQKQLAFIPRYFYLKSENDLLRDINMKLADEVNKLREARLENLRLQRLLEMKQQSSFKLVAAKVAGKNFNLYRNNITLNVGSVNGILPRMPVVNDRGLIGIIRETTEHYCIVTTMQNIDFRASVKVQRSRVDGIIAWDGTNLILRNVSKTSDVKIGDVIFTSEYSRTFPPNIRIGIVSSVQDESGSLFKKVVVTSSIDFIRLEEVFVITKVPDDERAKLEKER